MERDPEHEGSSERKRGRRQATRSGPGELTRSRRKWPRAAPRARSLALPERRRAAADRTGGSSSSSGASSGGPRRFRTRTCSRSAPPACRPRRSGDAVGRPATAASRSTKAGPSWLVRGELQAAQPLGAQARRQPGDDGADMAALQRLLERPQAVAAGDDAGAGVDDEQLLDVEAEAGERRRRQRRRRIEDHHQPTGPLRRDQRRREQADLADAGMRQQQLGERPARPAAAGQLGVERGEAGRHRVAAAAAELVAEPERRMQGFGRTHGLAHERTRRLARRRAREQAALGARRGRARRRCHGGRNGIHELTVRLYSIDRKTGCRQADRGRVDLLQQATD